MRRHYFRHWIRWKLFPLSQKQQKIELSKCNSFSSTFVNNSSEPKSWIFKTLTIENDDDLVCIRQLSELGNQLKFLRLSWWIILNWTKNEAEVNCTKTWTRQTYITSEASSFWNSSSSFFTKRFQSFQLNHAVVKSVKNSDTFF